MDAQTLVKRAAVKAHVLEKSETMPPDMLATHIETLNELLETWRDDGIDLGLSLPLAADEELDIDSSAVRTLTYNLAVEIGNDEHAAVPQLTVEIAERTKSSYRRCSNNC